MHSQNISFAPHQHIFKGRKFWRIPRAPRAAPSWRRSRPRMSRSSRTSSRRRCSRGARTPPVPKCSRSARRCCLARWGVMKFILSRMIFITFHNAGYRHALEDIKLTLEIVCCNQDPNIKKSINHCKIYPLSRTIQYPINNLKNKATCSTKNVFQARVKNSLILIKLKHSGSVWKKVIKQKYPGICLVEEESFISLTFRRSIEWGARGGQEKGQKVSEERQQRLL